MLLSFTFSNFRSFNDTAELTFAAGNTKKHPSHISEVQNMQVLKYGAIYGANAAGKTSLIKAMNASKSVILGMPINRINNSWCRIDDKNKTKPTSFEYLFETNGHVYQYGFDIILSESKIISEWAYEVANGLSTETKIFSRELEEESYEYDFSYFTDDSKERLNVYADDLSDRYDRLFLTEMKTKKLKEDQDSFVFHDIFQWFIEKLIINGHGSAETDNDLAEVSRRLSAYDTGISAAEYQLIKNPPDGIPEELITMLKDDQAVYTDNGLKIMKYGEDISLYKLKLTHDSSINTFDFTEESAGTREAYDRILTMFTGNKSDTTFIFDEFGHHMHPVLAKRVVTDFENYNKEKNNQLIIATHHTGLMSMDLYRRDEIYFIERREGLSELYSLEQFDERFDAVVQKRYLEGRFGALPVIQEINASGGE